MEKDSKYKNKKLEYKSPFLEKKNKRLVNIFLGLGVLSFVLLFIAMWVYG